MRAVVVVLLMSCASPDAPARVEVASFPATRAGALDIAVVIDNSIGTEEFQFQLAHAIPALFDGLRVDGAVPDLRVAVLDGDLGTSSSTDFDHPAPNIGTVDRGGCAGHGDAGEFVALARDPIGVSKGVLRGDGLGCGFQQHLHALRRSQLANPTADFWRSNASTAYILLADEDDCSVQSTAMFLNDDPTLVQPSTYRCTQHGIQCDQSLDEVGPKTGCRPRADSLVEDPIASKNALELAEPNNPNVTFSVIGGAPEPLEVTTFSSGAPRLVPACTLASPRGGMVANPAPRLASLAASFGSRGGFYSVCETDYASTMRSIATTIKRSLGVACILPHDDCIARDVSGSSVRVLPRCPAARDCFDLVPDAGACRSDELRVVVDRKTTPPLGTRTEVFCR